MKNYIGNLPKKGRGEASRLANSLGVSTTLISQVLSGAKSLTPEQTQRLIAYLGLTSLEADYLTFMVHKERAGTADLKKYWNSKLSQIREDSLKISNRVKIDKILNDEERVVFYSSPLYSAIRLYTSVGENGKNLFEICERFEISRAKAANILNFLVKAGLCEEKNNRYLLGAQKTHLEHDSPHLLRHHSNWRSRAIYYSESLLESEMMYTAPVSLSRKDFEILREEMAVFIKKFLERVHNSSAEEIACLNLDFFWIRK
ncbi:MAG: hypothetical protein A4S09_13995 [Proteobacteria bacterium SG_bin7]|nr:MAG: hypothetical protein A4S09_13995 [Proteobacteria bacterium SG_bin7]